MIGYLERIGPKKQVIMWSAEKETENQIMHP